MKGLSILPAESYRTTEWSGGTTTELIIMPEGSSYAERRFGFRISSAEVLLESSVFTRLEGVTRYISPLCEGFLLTVNGEKIPLKRGEILKFSGEDEVLCQGSGRDLNLMLKGTEGEMLEVRGGFTVPEHSFAYLFAPSPIRVSHGDETEELPAFALAAVEAGEWRAEGAAALFIIER